MITVAPPSLRRDTKMAYDETRTQSAVDIDDEVSRESIQFRKREVDESLEPPGQVTAYRGLCRQIFSFLVMLHLRAKIHHNCI